MKDLLKITTEYTILNTDYFCIRATVNTRNSISDFLDLKLWVQISELENLRSVFGTQKYEFSFPDLKYELEV